MMMKTCKEWLARPATRITFSSIYAAIVSVHSGGCAPEEDVEPEERAGSSSTIAGGKAALGVPEAVLIDMSGGAQCSGVVISPKVVLTAGHCIAGNSYTITAPFANGQTAKGVATWTDYKNTANEVNPNSLDVGAIILDRPIALDSYPPIARRPVAAGTSVVNVGRVKDKNSSSDQIFVGKPVKVSFDKGFPFSYVGDASIVEPGDSGGPTFTASGIRTIVAVNSGKGESIEILARVDLAAASLDSVIAQSDNPTNQPQQAEQPQPQQPRPQQPQPQQPQPQQPQPQGCGGALEQEPNDQTANQLSSVICGTLSSPSDFDHFSWLWRQNETLNIQLAANGDAIMEVFAQTTTGWQAVAMNSTRQLHGTAQIGGTFLARIRSPSGTPQQYRITVTP